MLYLGRVAKLLLKVSVYIQFGNIRFYPGGLTCRSACRQTLGGWVGLGLFGYYCH